MPTKTQNLAVKIIPYDDKAPAIFGKIKQSICNIIPYKFEIEHIGSTSVVGLGGKGIIDVLIITGQEYMRKIVDLLVASGYKYNPEAINIEEKPFVSGPFKYNENELHIHIHITFHGSKYHKNMLLFRDYLREHPEEAKTYYALKKQWSIEAGLDRYKYTKLKTQYVNQVLEKARMDLGVGCNGV
jgi:GrpB-like predicted nucleotidyltransferase (UPF0157 family)